MSSGSQVEQVPDHETWTWFSAQTGQILAEHTPNVFARLYATAPVRGAAQCRMDALKEAWPGLSCIPVLAPVQGAVATFLLWHVQAHAADEDSKL